MVPTETCEPTGFRESHDPADGGGLVFQRCLWCRTPAYRRSSCRACGSTAFRRERSAGAGVVVRRNGPALQHTWFVAMDEGFHLLCRIEETDPVVVSIGARVSVVRPAAPPGPGLPVAEPTRPAAPAGHWW